MRKGLLLATVLCLLLPWSGLASPEPADADAAGDAQAKIAPELRAELASLAPGEMLSVVVSFKAQANLTLTRRPDRAARLKAVITALQATADATQKPIRAFLQAKSAQGLVGQTTYFWVFNGLAVTATRDVIWELAARPDVQRITPDEIAIGPVTLAAGNPPETNLSVINAPGLWDLGFLGQGIVVANMDTGVDVSHPDLAARWRGGTNSWFDPYGQHPVTPADLNGHGTWTMGIMVGSDAGGTAIGVAPQAQWIAVKIFNDQGYSTATAVHQGFQWLLDPDGNPDTADAPHVVNNSWTFISPGCDLEFQPDLQALRAAGILPVFAAGNFGPDSGTSRSPANNPAAFAVGATNDSNLIYAYSSRGPSSCGNPSTTYPDLVAPGVLIRTAGLYGTYDDATGTSVAAPHVAGGLALLLSAYPGLSDIAQEHALINGAVDLGTPGTDNDFGNGRLDLLAAYHVAAGGADLAIGKTDAFDPVYTGGTLTYTLLVTNTGPGTATAVTVTDALPLGVTYSGASGDGWICDHSGGILTCTRSSLAVGVAPRIVVAVAVPVSSGTITNTAVVTSTRIDPNPANNTDAEQTRVITPGAEQASLSIAMADHPDPVSAGATLIFTLAVSNSGPYTATEVTVIDTLPPEVTFGGVLGDGWTCDGDSGMVICGRSGLGVMTAPHIVISVTAPLSGGMIINKAVVSGREIDPSLEDNTATAETQVSSAAMHHLVYLPLIKSPPTRSTW